MLVKKIIFLYKLIRNILRKKIEEWGLEYLY